MLAFNISAYIIPGTDAHLVDVLSNGIHLRPYACVTLTYCVSLSEWVHCPTWREAGLHDWLHRLGRYPFISASFSPLPSSSSSSSLSLSSSSTPWLNSSSSTFSPHHHHSASISVHSLPSSLSATMINITDDLVYLYLYPAVAQKCSSNPKPDSRKRNVFSWPKSELELRFRFVLTCLTLPKAEELLLYLSGLLCLCPALHASARSSRLTAPPRILSSQVWHLAPLAAVLSFSGTAVVTQTKAAVWTDSRYWVQAERQMDCSWELERDGMPAPFVIICCGDPEHTATDNILLVWVFNNVKATAALYCMM